MLAGVVFAWTLVALIFASACLREGGLLCQATPTGRIYRAHPYGRIFAAMLGLLFTVGASLMYAPEFLKPGRNGESMPGWGWFPFALVIAMNTAMGLLMFWLAGPNDFFLDLDRRTYRHVYGWPFRPQVREGSWEEMAGVYVRCRRMTDNEQYIVGLTWKCPRSHSPVLGAFSRPSQADWWAEGVAATLGLPLVPPPSYLKSSPDVRNGLG